MSEEEQISSTLDVSDLDNMLRAVKHAHTKGAYTMEEVSQLFPVVQRVEAWLKAYKSQLEATTTEPMPEAEVEGVELDKFGRPVAEEPKKKKAKKQKR